MEKNGLKTNGAESQGTEVHYANNSVGEQLGAPQRYGRRTVRAAHQGFGFGANAIREKSISVAREASDRKTSRLQELLSEPVNANAHPFVVPSPRTSAIVAPATNAAAPATVPATRSERRFSRVVPGLAKPSIDVQKSASQKKKVNEIAANGVSEEVTLGRAMMAWVLDSVVACSAAVMAMGAGFISDVPNMGEPMFRMLNKISVLAGTGNPFLMVALFQTVVAALAIIFATQLTMLLFTGATAGRFAMGIRFAQNGALRRVVQSLAVALSETLTAGGLLSLPFVITIPSRAALAPWVHFNIVRANSK